MKLIMVAAVSQDGFITKGDDANVGHWTSKEDKAFFSEIRQRHKLFVMGSTTFTAAGVGPSAGVLRVVLTKRPQDFASLAIPGQLEFHNLSPLQFAAKYEEVFSSCLVLGGSQVYTGFLEAGLIDEAYLTIEPVRHRSGTPLIKSGQTIEEFFLSPPETKPLNAQGTVLKHYTL